jgi:hypothetical protein
MDTRFSISADPMLRPKQRYYFDAGSVQSRSDVRQVARHGRQVRDNTDSSVTYIADVLGEEQVQARVDHLYVLPHEKM